MASEFDLIRRYFAAGADSSAGAGDGTRLGIGDDAALVRVGLGMELAVSTDMLLEGRHFTAGCDPHALGHKALAVNLSDMAAMGATPRWMTLAVALPDFDERWLESFSGGLFALAGRYEVSLVGGDTTRGPRAISITVLGEVPGEFALLRGGARPGDDIWVSGELGAAALGLAAQEGRVQLAAEDAIHARSSLERPEPRVELGERLRGLANAAIDVSDGFAADLGHVLERSGSGALVEYDRLPACAVLARLGDEEFARRCVLSGGDDYELVFTAETAHRGEIDQLGVALGVPLARVGSIRRGESRLVVVDALGTALGIEPGFDHFADGT